MKYVLIGFMGAGKSSLLCRLGSLPQVDLDYYLERLHQCSISDLIQNHGLKNFRKLEIQALKLFFQAKSKVFALGGGTTEAHAKDLLQMQKENQIVLVWLSTTFETCWERIKNDADKRPLVHQGESALRELYEKRRQDYQKALVWLDEDQQGQIGSLDDLQNWPRRMDDEAR
jgi:shikimate kinase